MTNKKVTSMAEARTKDDSAMTAANERKKRRAEKQRDRRALDTGTREAMIAWSASPAGKAARHRYMNSSGRKKEALLRAKGGSYYAHKQDTLRRSAKSANNGYRRWSSAEEDILVQMTAAGHIASEIAEKLGRSILSIEHKRARILARAV